MSLSFPVAKEPPLLFSHRGTRSGLRFLARVRFQLAGALLLAVLLPALLVPGFSLWSDSFGRAGLIGTAIAVFGGALVLRKIRIYPGVQAPAYVFPVFISSFGLVIVLFFFARLDYSRVQFVVSFLCTILWFMFVLRIERRLKGLRYLLIPFGNTTRLIDLASAEWDFAASPQHEFTTYSGVVADLRADMPPEWQGMLATAALEGVPVYHSKFLSEALTGRVEIEHFSENNLGSLIPSSVYHRFRRFVDLSLALITLPVTVPVIAVAALVIKVSDGGPAFFYQERIGYRGKKFTLIKLRTMRTDTDNLQLFTDEGDTRITGAGKWLRRLRIDELPQIVNIVRGEMGWIGPRPEALSLANWYESQIPFYSYRHIVRPGITGWAAVNQGNVAMIAEATAKLHFDFYYIKHFSPWLDLLILAKTVRTVVTGFGAK